MTVSAKLRTASASLTSPLALPGLAAWYNAGQLTGLANTDPVTTWPDLSGNGRHATQATSGKRPTYRTSALNSQPVIRFDGTDDALVTATFGATLPQPTTIVLVCQLASTTGAALVDGIDCTDRQVIWYNVGFWGLQSGGVLFGTETVDTNPHIWFAAFGATDTLRIDGTQVASGDSGSAAMGGLRLGGWCDSSGYPPADYAELIVYNRAVTSDERRRLEGYLGLKYGIGVA